MNLELNTATEVNQIQYLWSKVNLKGIVAHRIDKEGKFWIKPLIFVGYKKFIEENLIKLA